MTTAPHRLIAILGLIFTLGFIAYLMLAIPSVTLRSITRSSTLETLSQMREINEVREFASDKLRMLFSSTEGQGSLLRIAVFALVLNGVLFASSAFWFGRKGQIGSGD
jgi:hypothetical protein